MGCVMPDLRIAFMPLGLALLSGCTTADKVVGRYHSAQCETVSMAASVGQPPAPPDFIPVAEGAKDCARIVPTASASAVSLPAAVGSGSKSGTDLPDRAMASYITALARLSRTPSALSSALGADIGDVVRSPGVQDRTVFKRTVIVSVRLDGGYNPADRLEQTDVLIRLHRARFVSWDVIATDYQTINAGKIGLVTTNGTTEGLTVGTPATAPVSATATLGASQSSARTEDLDATTKVPNLSATVDADGSLRIFRRGGYGIDLSGNSVIRAEIRYTGEPGPGDRGAQNSNYTSLWDMGPYTGKGGRPITSARVKAAVRPVLEVPEGATIRADVYLNYTIRHILGGGDTYEEKDDDTLNRTVGPIYRSVVLISGRDADIPGFTVDVRSGPHRGILNVQQPGAAASNLCFGTYGEALEFLRYMRTAPGGPPASFGNVLIGSPDATSPGVPGIARLTRADLDVATPRPGCT